MKGLPRERIQSFYDCPNPFYKKGAKQVQALFWPCTVFTVAISQQKSDALNIFEKAILRLMSLGIRDKELSDTLTIKIDFLRFWLERLNQTAYLSGSKLTEAAIKFVNGKEDEVYRNVMMYREEVEGALLPFCVSGAPQYLQADAKGAFFGNPAHRTESSRLLQYCPAHPVAGKCPRLAPSWKHCANMTYGAR